MNIIANPKTSMWLCRLIPAVTWLLWLVVILSGHTYADLTVAEILFFASLVLYIPLVYFMLPVLLFGSASKSFVRKIAYFFFTAVTAGIGPVIWYFASIDGVLRRMADSRKRDYDRNV